MDGATVRVQCAATTRGCMAFLVFDAPPGMDVYRDTGGEVPEDERVERILRMNGWHLDHGRWVCAAHPAPRRLTGSVTRHGQE